MAGDVDVVIVVGSRAHHGPACDEELAEKLSTPGHLTDCPEDIQTEWVEGKKENWCDSGCFSAWKS